MRTLISLDWYDGVLAGFAADIPVIVGPCRFECIATNLDHQEHDERLFVIAPLSEADMLEATALAKDGAGEMMYYPLENSNAIEAVNAIIERTEAALTDQRSLLLFTSDLTGEIGLVREVGNAVQRVEQALQQRHRWHGDLGDWADVRATAMPLGRSTP